MSSVTNSERVVKNTLYLYIRMILLTFVSLYTVRVVLRILGTEDYGLYNVVGGIVSLMTFFTGAMADASQRYFAIGLAKNDWNEVNKFFSVNFTIYLVFAVIIIFLGETLGFWFLLNKMTIPDSRMTACIWVYQLSIFTFIISMLNAPFQALLVANEQISIYAYISVFDGLFKLLVVYILSFSSFDKLITYSVLLSSVSIIHSMFYILYSIYKYKELKIDLFKSEKSDFKNVFSYVSWNLIGTLATICKGQGVNIVINLFFNPSVNAARGLSLSIKNVVLSFAQNFLKAVSPQITKKYATNDNNLLNLINSSSKMAFSLLFIVVLPLVLNMKDVLVIWLGKTVPQHTIEFAILALFDTLIFTITDPIGTSVCATGNVKIYQISTGFIRLLCIPLSYISLCYIKNPCLPFYVSILLSTIEAFVRIKVYSKLNNDFRIFNYLKNVVLPIIINSIIIFALAFYLKIDNTSIITIGFNTLIEIILVSSIIYTFVLNSYERELIKTIISNFSRKIRCNK